MNRRDFLHPRRLAQTAGPVLAALDPLDPPPPAVATDEYPLLRVARSRLRSAQAAEDAVQETFLAAYKSRHTYRDEFSFRTWLWTILLNQCRSQQQRLARLPQTPGGSANAGESWLEASLQVEATQPLPLAQLLASERRDLLESLLGRLTPAQADALRLRFYGGLKFQEIADIMHMGLSATKMRYKRALDRLREKFSGLAET